VPSSARTVTGTTGPAENVYEADFLDLQIVPPEFTGLAGPGADIKSALVVIEAVEDELVLLPILRLLNVESFGS